MARTARPRLFEGVLRRVPRVRAGGLATSVGIAALAALFTLFAAPSVHADNGAADDVTPAAIDAVVREHREAVEVPGVAVVVTQGTEVLHTQGYGTTTSGEDVTAHTPMAVASVSKSFTAAAVLRLVESGQVDLDEPVVTYLPEFEMADSRYTDITVRHLLDQTSGMSDTTFPAFSREQPETLSDGIASMRTGELAADPGERYEYHNPNFQVAARLVEVVAERPFDEQLADTVFGPLDMADSWTINTESDLPSSAYGHIRILGRPITVPEPSAFGNGSGGVISTAADMSAWLIAQNNEGRGPDGAQIVSPETTTLMHTPSPNSGSYALGWSVDETPEGAPIIEHGGDLFASTAYQAVLPDSGHGVAVMANTGMAYGDAQTIGAAIISVIEDGEPPTPASGSALVWTDAVFLSLSVGVAVLSWRAVRRSQRWARRRAANPGWAAARLLPLVLPPLLFAGIHQIVGFLFRGRDVAWIQVSYLYPTFMIALAVAALGCAVVAAARVAGVIRRRNHSETQPPSSRHVRS